MLALSAPVPASEPDHPPGAAPESNHALPAIHGPAERDAAPQAAGECRQLSMRRATLLGCALGDGRCAVQPDYLFGCGTSTSVGGFPGD